ncbi:MAG: hypothetical protein KUL75_04265 [Sterolibacterium sp.]|nr:hypothetical protein [Sterolibacterium sp.]
MASEENKSPQAGEVAIAGMAATIFGALIQKIDLYPANEDELVDRSVGIAIKLMNRAEKRLKRD